MILIPNNVINVFMIFSLGLFGHVDMLETLHDPQDMWILVTWIHFTRAGTY